MEGVVPTQHKHKGFVLWVLVCLITIWLFPTTAPHLAATMPPVGIQLVKTPLADAYVASGRPDQRSPTLRIMWVGYNEEDDYGVERALITFPMDGIPLGSRIDRAALSLYLSGTTRNDAPMEIRLYRLLGDWAETINWREHESLQLDANRFAAMQVGTTFTWYQWDVHELVQAWLDDPNRTPGFGLRMQGNEAPGQHERNFWSKDCSDCGDPPNLPQLEILFSTPTPTPLPPTPTHTPTVTPTPTPGMASLLLRSQPANAITAGQRVLYTLTYQNGPYPLGQMQITNTAPANVKLLPQTIGSSITQVVTFTQAGVIIWLFDTKFSLPAHASGSISYQVECCQATDALAAANAPEAVVIVNRGAYVSWRYEKEARQRMKSNGTRNPPLYLYLPIVAKK
jgi:hypothetical protein